MENISIKNLLITSYIIINLISGVVFLVPTFFGYRVIAENLFGVINYGRMEISFLSFFIFSSLIIFPVWAYFNYLIYSSIKFKFYWRCAFLMSVSPSVYLVVNSLVHGV